ncbi:MAG: cell division protein SepF [Helcococcus sp.]|nr:cell division protein SepF [Helcococcus sp.]
MAIWDKIKDFIGIEDDYYDEDYDEYIDDNFGDNEEAEDIVSDETTKLDKTLKSEKTDTNLTQTISHRPIETNRYYKTKSGENMVVTIREPMTYEDGKLVIDDILQRKAVVLNLENLEVDKKTQIFYFVSGGVYSLKGTIQNVTKDIYVLAPEGVEIDGKASKIFADKNLY